MATNVSPTHDESAVRDIIDRLNHAWLHEGGEAMAVTLANCFAEDVVMRGPSLMLLGRGRDFAVQSYRDFVTQAEVKQFSLEPAEIDIWGNIAVAQYKWTMTYALSGQESIEEGNDIFMLACRNDKWLIVWRALLPTAG